MSKFYRHIRPESVDKKHKNKTVAGVLENDTLRIGISICSNNDHFNKKLGRVISEGRAIKNPEMVLHVEDYPTALKKFHSFCNSLGGKQVELK